MDVDVYSTKEEERYEASVSLICVVDDDDSICEALSSLLRSVGYKCALFSSAEAFLKSESLGETDCIVLDILLPGLTGLELQLKLREMNCPVPIVFVTGQPDSELRAKALNNGAIDFLGKPLDEEALLCAIRTALDS